MVDNDKLYGSIKLEDETVFFHNISLNKEKLKLYKQGIVDGKITYFDPIIIKKLKNIYYAVYSGLLYIYGEPTTFDTIGNKVELLTHVLGDKEYNIVHGSTDSTRDIPFFMYGVEHLDFNSWIEVEEENKTWVYDLFSLLKIEKNLYYELEQPEISRIVSKETIINHPGRDPYDFTYPTVDYLTYKIISDIEKNMDNHPFKNILLPELSRYKNKIKYEDLKREFNENTKKK